MTGLKILIGFIVLLVICGFVGYLWSVLFRRNIVSEVTESKLIYIGVALFVAGVAGPITGDQDSKSSIDYGTVGFALLFMFIGYALGLAYTEQIVEEKKKKLKRLLNKNAKVDNKN